MAGCRRLGLEEIVFLLLIPVFFGSKRPLTGPYQPTGAS